MKYTQTTQWSCSFRGCNKSGCWGESGRNASLGSVPLLASFPHKQPECGGEGRALENEGRISAGRHKGTERERGYPQIQKAAAADGRREEGGRRRGDLKANVCHGLGLRGGGICQVWHRAFLYNGRELYAFSFTVWTYNRAQTTVVALGNSVRIFWSWGGGRAGKQRRRSS